MSAKGFEAVRSEGAKAAFGRSGLSEAYRDLSAGDPERTLDLKDLLRGTKCETGRCG